MPHLKVYSMTYKKNILAFLAALLCILMSGCRHAPLQGGPDDLQTWLAQDPDSCLWYVTDRYVPLLKQKDYEEMERLYASVLRAMPARPEGSKDVNYLAGWVLTYYYNALMLQDKVDGCERLPDSLSQSSHPFYKETMQPELLATCAKFYVAQNRQDRVDSIGRLFLALAPTDDPRRDARAWHQMAWAMEQSDIDIALPQRLMEHAVEACRRVEGKVGNEGEIYEYAGYLCWRNGELEKATLYIQQAVDWYTARPGTPGDGLIEAYNDLAGVYAGLGLYDKALEANRAAMDCSVAADNWMLEEVYRLRASCFDEAGRPDSSLYYIQKSAEATPKSAEGYYKTQLRIQRLGHYYAAFPDSIGSQLEECRLLLPDTARVDAEFRVYLQAYYGLALLHTPGHGAEGVEWLEKSFRLFRDGHYPEGVVQAGHQLINAYIRSGMTDRIASVYPVYISTRDSLESRKNVNAAIGANIRYETGRKEQENRVLAAEVSLKRRTLAFTWVLVGVLAVALAAGGLYLRQRQRLLRRISDARLSQISALLCKQKELHEKNDSLLQVQAELRQSNEALSVARQELEKYNLSLCAELQEVSGKFDAVSSRLESISKQKKLEDIRVKLNTELLDSDKEAEFRRSFMAVYPNYLSSLRRFCGEVTRTDELLAMLLVFDSNANGIALTLGISRNGVNKARSRMRQRLGLKSGESLEEFLMRFIG